MEQEVSKTSPETTTAALELLEQSGITRHWSKLMDAIKEGDNTADSWMQADIALRLRGQQLYAFALWIGEEIKGYVIFEPVVSGDDRMLNVRALSGTGISVEQWRDLIAQVADVFRSQGYTQMVALSANPRVCAIMEADGWRIMTYGEREF